MATGAGVEAVGAGVDAVGAGVEAVGAGVDAVGAGVEVVGAGVGPEHATSFPSFTRESEPCILVLLYISFSVYHPGPNRLSR